MNLFLKLLPAGVFLFCSPLLSQTQPVAPPAGPGAIAAPASASPVPVEFKLPIQISDLDAYVQKGFDPNNLTGWNPRALENKGWHKIPAKSGDRHLRIADLELPGYPERGFLTWEHFPDEEYTILTRFRLPWNRDAWPASPGLYISGMGENWEIFLNGTRIASEMHRDAAGQVLQASHRSVMMPIDWRLLKPGNNDLSFRIVGDPTNHFTGLTASQPNIIAEYDDVLARSNETVSLILFTLILAVGAYHLLLFSRRTKDLHNLFFALFCFSFFLYQYSNTHHVKGVFSDSDFVYGFNYPSIYTTLPMLLLFLEFLLLQRITIFTKIFTGVMVGLALLNIAAPVAAYEDVLRLFFMSIIPGLLYLLGFIVYKTSRRIYRVYRGLRGKGNLVTQVAKTFGNTLIGTVEGNLFLGVVVGFFAAVFDILDDLFFNTGLRFTKFGVFLFILGLAATLANRFVTVYNESDRLNDELAAKNKELSRLDKMKDEFLANTSHELRTPLNGIIGIAESLLDGAAGKLEEGVRDNLSMIAFSGRRLASLVNDLLDFSQLKTKDLTLSDKPVDLYQLTRLVIALLGPLANGKGLVVKNLVPRDIPAVHGDENRLQQVLNNLIGNAVKFTDAGSVEISAERTGDMITVSIVDTGVGIPADRLEDIFKSFEQVDASTTRKYGGTGLGLSISRKLIELHGGEISVKSEVATGSTFTFTLPVSSGVPEQIAEADLAVRVRSDDRYQPTRNEPPPMPTTVPARAREDDDEDALGGRGLHVLVVDDEPINLQVVSNYLSVQGYKISRAGSGAEALTFIRDAQNKPDIVLLDVMMPGMSGLDVCRIVRENTPANILPIIMLTAKNQVNDLIEGLSTGANDYLTKPFSKKELLARIRTHVELSKINVAYNRFVPSQFLNILEKESIVDVHLGDQVQKEMTVLFSDIRHFTTLSETMTPKENFDFINAYLKRVSPIIREFRGFIDKYIGDAVMALFNEPVDALSASVEMHRKLNAYNDSRNQRGFQRIEIGIGLHAGSLMLGTIGDEERMEGTVISDAVNLASRMEGLTKMYGASIIISGDTLEKIGAAQRFRHRALDQVKVKGKRQAVTVIEVFEGDPPQMANLKAATRDVFESGLEAYLAQDFSRALERFTKVLDANPEDVAARLYEQRSRYYVEHGVPPEWEGVAVFDTK